MCIIASKPQGIPLPSLKVLKHCWQSNPDGAGFCYIRQGQDAVTIQKGFMKFKTFYSALESAKLTDKDAVILHFRIATHGLVDGGNCHPFPISASPDDLRSLSIKTSISVAHNGIFGGMPAHTILSDTQKFVSKIMSNRHVINGINSSAVQELLRGYCGDSSKLAILTPKSHIHIGKFIEEDGMLYSNHGYKPYNNSYINKNTGYYNTCSAGKTTASRTCAYCEATTNVHYYTNLCTNLCDSCASYHLLEKD